MLCPSPGPEITRLLFLPGLCLHRFLCLECPSSIILPTGSGTVTLTSKEFASQKRLDIWFHRLETLGRSILCPQCPAHVWARAGAQRACSRSETLLCTWLWSGEIHDQTQESAFLGILKSWAGSVIAVRCCQGLWSWER